LRATADTGFLRTSWMNPTPCRCSYGSSNPDSPTRP
jgi:hypothetical protein